MTISTPSLPSDSLAAGTPSGADADLLATLGVATTPPGTPAVDGSAPTDTAGFAGLLPEADIAEPEPSAPATNEQAAALAAALLWTPAPLLVETAPKLGLQCAIESEPQQSSEQLAASVQSETGETGQAQAPVVIAGRDPRPAQTVQSQRGARFSAGKPAQVEKPAARPETIPAMPAAAPAVAPSAIAPTALVSNAAAASLPSITGTAPATDLPAPLAEDDSSTVTTADEPTAIATEDVPSVLAATVSDTFTGRPAFRLPAHKEKIAALPGLPLRGFDSRSVAEGKTFLSATPQAGREEPAIVGTTVAKSEATMPAAPAVQPPAAETPAASPVFTLPAGHATTAQAVPHLEFSGLVTAEPAVQARDAVGAVMQVVNAQEQNAAAASQVVNLDFNFGEDRLAVRVEHLRDGTVQAHFRTESPELRAALAHEWHQAAAAPENILRFAEPSFQAAARSETPAGLGANVDGGAAQGQSRQSQPAEIFNRSAARPVSAATTPEAPRVRHLATTRHLQAVA